MRIYTIEGPAPVVYDACAQVFALPPAAQAAACYETRDLAALGDPRGHSAAAYLGTRTLLFVTSTRQRLLEVYPDYRAAAARRWADARARITFPGYSPVQPAGSVGAASAVLAALADPHDVLVHTVVGLVPAARYVPSAPALVVERWWVQHDGCTTPEWRLGSGQAPIGTARTRREVVRLLADQLVAGVPPDALVALRTIWPGGDLTVEEELLSLIDAIHRFAREMAG